MWAAESARLQGRKGQGWSRGRPLPFASWAQSPQEARCSSSVSRSKGVLSKTALVMVEPPTARRDFQSRRPTQLCDCSWAAESAQGAALDSATATQGAHCPTRLPAGPKEGLRACSPQPHAWPLHWHWPGGAAYCGDRCVPRVSGRLGPQVLRLSVEQTACDCSAPKTETFPPLEIPAGSEAAL